MNHNSPYEEFPHEVLMPDWWVRLGLEDNETLEDLGEIHGFTDKVDTYCCCTTPASPVGSARIRDVR